LVRFYAKIDPEDPDGVDHAPDQHVQWVRVDRPRGREVDEDTADHISEVYNGSGEIAIPDAEQVEGDKDRVGRARGGSSLVAENIQILCAKHNLRKGGKNRVIFSRPSA